LAPATAGFALTTTHEGTNENLSYRLRTFDVPGFGTVVGTGSHHRQVTKVTVQNGVIYVKGSSWTGAGCQDLYGTYGTLYTLATDPGYKNFYALALSAQLSGKGLWCYVGTRDSNNVCKMENCAIAP
jgi:hypothetical protein